MGDGDVRNENVGAVGNLVQLRDIHGGLTINAVPTESRVPPRQLPAAATQFTGREGELRELHRLLDGGGGDAAGVLVVSAIAGKPGVGKSALAVTFAHQVRERFPDGQLYVDLRGADGEGRLASGSVLGQFLRALGVAAQDVPEETEERAARYRSLLAGRRVLVLLDNAHDEGQVRPLLPGTSDCLALVTSRRPLAALEVAPAPLRLDVLGEASAVRLLGRLAGQHRVASEPEEAAELVRLCGHLPLALRIVAGRLATRPAWRLADLRERLAEERRRLTELRLGDLDVRASFLLSYRELPSSQARLFRRLGVLPGYSFGVELAAVVGRRALTGSALTAYQTWADRLGEGSLTPGDVDVSTEVESDLDALADAQFIEPTEERRRYRLHDLLGLFARERLEEEEAQEDVSRAGAALADWSVLAVAETMAVIEQGDRSVPTHWQREWATVTAVTQSAITGGLDYALPMVEPVVALGWLFGHDDWERWHETLLTAIGLAERQGHGLQHARLSRLLGLQLGLRGQWAEAMNCLQRSLRRCLELGDATLEALVRGNLASVLLNTHRHQDVLVQLRRIDRLLPTCDSDTGRRDVERVSAKVWADLLETMGRTADACRQLERLAALCRGDGDRRGVAAALCERGRLLVLQGQADEAIAVLEEGLAVAREVGAGRHTEPIALHCLARAHHLRGDLVRSLRYSTEALDRYREVGPPQYEVAAAFEHAILLAALRRWDAADSSWERAEVLLEALTVRSPAQAAALRGSLPPRPRRSAP